MPPGPLCPPRRRRIPDRHGRNLAAQPRALRPRPWQQCTCRPNRAGPLGDPARLLREACVPASSSTKRAQCNCFNHNSAPSSEVTRIMLCGTTVSHARIAPQGWFKIGRRRRCTSMQQRLRRQTRLRGGPRAGLAFRKGPSSTVKHVWRFFHPPPRAPGFRTITSTFSWRVL